MAQTEIKSLKTAEKLETEKNILLLLDHLGGANIIKSNEALNELLLMPKENFPIQDLRRLQDADNKGYAKFAKMFMEKYY
ncbi:MAG: hypothetical protein NT165_02745 [Candidatus Falkowbacteria bacterium]|nr:hypothetical protein [Candidatus Falkowbacteria bacterium]